MNAKPIEVRLYTKPGCTPCAAVRGYLALRRRIYPHTLIEIDITQDAAARTLYRSSIPVVEIGAIRLFAPILNGDLELALRTALEQATDA